jgi:hypothetical protein
MLKLIYLARRKPGFTVDEFVRRWRKHGALGMEQAIWRHAIGYVQAEPIRPAPIEGASEEFDAVACFMVREEMFTHRTEEDAASGETMAKDELETFSGPIPNVSLWVKDEQIREGELGGITAYLFFQSATSAREVAEGARDTEGLIRLILNLRDDQLGKMNTLPYAAVIEMSACSIPALASAVGSNGKGPLSASDLAVITREAVLWDRMP